MKRRVVVTGLGALTPLGNSVAESWAGAIAGKSGIGPITRFDASAFASRIAGEIKDFDPTNYVDKKEIRHYDPFVIYALAASQMAIDDAGLARTHRATAAPVQQDAALGLLLLVLTGHFARLGLGGLGARGDT